MKNKILLLFALTISACGGGKKSNSDSDNKIQELGTCSSQLVLELNSTELGLKLYKDYGLKFGKDLVQAHIDYETIKNKYSSISCEAINRDNGQIITITKTTIEDLQKDVFSYLYSAHFSKCNNLSQKSSDEKSGCAHISFYMKKNFGYE